jgi:hypothetical protein
MKKSFVFALHTGFWGCYFILIIIVLGVYHQSVLNAGNPEAKIMNAFSSILLFAFLPSFLTYWMYYLFLAYSFQLQQR